MHITTNNQQPIHIAYCADENYVQHLATSLCSVMLNNPQVPLVFHAFLYQVSAASEHKLKQLSQHIHLHYIDDAEIEKYQQDCKLAHLNRSIYMRLSVPRRLAAITDRVIYLDIDTLCFSSVAEIHAINLDGVICAAVQDDHINPRKTSNHTRLQLKGGFYFNSGFLYINIPRWIEAKIEHRANQLLMQQNSFLYPDQDALNLVLDQHTLLLPRQWNFLYSWLTVKQHESFFYQSTTLPIIMHFTGGRKPWYQEHDGLAQTLYLFYRHFTPWKKEPLPLYQPKMQMSDYRLMAKHHFRKRRFLPAITTLLHYFYLKLKRVLSLK